MALTDVYAQDILEAKLKDLKSLKSLISIHTETELKDVKGSIGNFEIEIQNSSGSQVLNVGTVIIATGSDLYQPEEKFGYGKYDNIITNLEFEKNLKGEQPLNFKSGEPKKAVYILCVGSRTLDEPEDSKSEDDSAKVTNPGCSRVCCDVGIKHSRELQKAGIETTVLYRDIRTFDGGAEENYYEASREGVRFIRYDVNKPPEVTGEGKKVNVYDSLTNEILELEADLVILGCGSVPRVEDTAHIQSLFKIPKGADGFFLEAHPKLAPLETTSGGIYLCGTAQYPKSVHEAIAQGAGAGLKASILLSSDALVTEPVTASVDSTICWGCGTCTEVCMYGAPVLKESEGGKGKVSYINPTLCKGCGSCAARCPSGAIIANLFSHEQLIAMVNALGDEL
jgi:heterodisulfide reductase subunit A